ncbi:MAG TPA: hypothetical protein VEW65_12275, partial [Chryseolinea sp.]|nr:hypothetical protein [Chryseolinea sp.]
FTRKKSHFLPWREDRLPLQELLFYRYNVSSRFEVIAVRLNLHNDTKYQLDEVMTVFLFK